MRDRHRCLNYFPAFCFAQRSFWALEIAARAFAERRRLLPRVERRAPMAGLTALPISSDEIAPRTL